MSGKGLRFVRFLPGESDDIIAQEMTFDDSGRQMGALVRINSRTGRRTNIGVGQPDSGEDEGWLVDNAGVARALTVSGKGRTRIWYRASADAPWQQARRVREHRAGLGAASPSPTDGKTLLASTYAQGRQGRDRALRPGDGHLRRGGGGPSAGRPAAA